MPVKQQLVQQHSLRPRAGGVPLVPHKAISAGPGGLSLEGNEHTDSYDSRCGAYNTVIRTRPQRLLAPRGKHQQAHDWRCRERRARFTFWQRASWRGFGTDRANTSADPDVAFSGTGNVTGNVQSGGTVGSCTTVRNDHPERSGNSAGSAAGYPLRPPIFLRNRYVANLRNVLQPGHGRRSGRLAAPRFLHWRPVLTASVTSVFTSDAKITISGPVVISLTGPSTLQITASSLTRSSPRTCRSYRASWTQRFPSPPAIAHPGTQE